VDGVVIDRLDPGGEELVQPDDVVDRGVTGLDEELGLSPVRMGNLAT
jgi:hypothetical protein